MNHPLFCRFPNELRLSPDFVVEWTTRGRDFFLRPVGGELDIVWCQLDGHSIADKLEAGRYPPSVFRRLSQSWNKRSFWRFWPLPNGCESLLRRNFGLVRRDGDEFWLRATWRRPCSLSGDELLFRSGANMASVVDNLESVGHFDEARALSETREPSWRWFCCVHGDFEELQRLVNAYLILSGGEVRYYGGGPLQFQSILHPPQSFTPEQWNSKWRFAALLDSHFTLRARDFALRLHDARGYSRRSPPLHIERNGVPTTHEILEAHLFLRDWLRGKISDAEIETIFRPVAA